MLYIYMSKMLKKRSLNLNKILTYKLKIILNIVRIFTKTNKHLNPRNYENQLHRSYQMDNRSDNDTGSTLLRNNPTRAICSLIK